MLVVTASCTTHPQQIESQQQVYNKLYDKQQVLQRSWTTCRTASPRQIHS